MDYSVIQRTTQRKRITAIPFESRACTVFPCFPLCHLIKIESSHTRLYIRSNDLENLRNYLASNPHFFDF